MVSTPACVLPQPLTRTSRKTLLAAGPRLPQKADAAKKASPPWQRLPANPAVASAPALNRLGPPGPAVLPPQSSDHREVIAAELGLSQENKPPAVDGHLCAGMLPLPLLPRPPSPGPGANLAGFNGDRHSLTSG